MKGVSDQAAAYRPRQPVRVGSEDAWQTITPTTEWQTMKTTRSKESFMVQTNRYYVNVNKS